MGRGNKFVSAGYAYNGVLEYNKINEGELLGQRYYYLLMLAYTD